MKDHRAAVLTAMRQTYTLLAKATIIAKNGRRYLNAICDQAIVKFAVKQICSGHKLLLNCGPSCGALRNRPSATKNRGNSVCGEDGWIYETTYNRISASKKLFQ